MTLTDTRIKAITESLSSPLAPALEDLLLYKNQKYGDAAINPKNIFYKGESTNSIYIRLDDKVSRILANPEPTFRVNDVADIAGYSVLALISMGVSELPPCVISAATAEIQPLFPFISSVKSADKITASTMTTCLLICLKTLEDMNVTPEDIAKFKD